MMEPGEISRQTSPDNQSKAAESGNSVSIRKGGTDWYSLSVLWLATLAVSGVISLYVMAIAWLNIKDIDIDPIDRAAYQAAAEVSNLAVHHRDFGALVLNQPPDDLNRARSFNTVVSLLRTSLYLANRLELKVVQEEAEKDYAELLSQRARLLTLVEANLKPSPVRDKPSQNGVSVLPTNTYARVRQTIVGSLRQSEKLTDLSIKCGTLKHGQGLSKIPAENDEEKAPYVENGRLKTMVPVPIPLKTPTSFIFHQEPLQSKIVRTGDFVPLKDRQTLPSALLLEATMEEHNRRSGKGAVSYIKRRICISLGASDKESLTAAPLSKPLPTCLAISFPHGRLATMDSLASLLQCKTWLGNGNWTEYAGNAGSGSGRLSPTANPVIKQMSPGDSLSLLLYHFLRNQTTPISPGYLRNVVNETFPPPPPPSDSLSQAGNSRLRTLTDDPLGESDRSYKSYLEIDEAIETEANSCLIQNTDARSFSYLYKGGPKEQGQLAVAAAFKNGSRRFPASALPVVVSARGEPTLPGQKSFQKKLVTDLLTSLYNTNLAANDTLATARIMQANALKRMKDSTDKNYLLVGELSYLRSKSGLNQTPAERKKLNEEITLRESRIEYERKQQQLLLNIGKLAAAARANADRVAAASFDCGAHLFLLAAGGINRPDQEKDSFILGKRFAFRPVASGLSESELYESAQALTENPAAKLDSPWLNGKMQVFGTARGIYQKPDTQIMVEGKSLSELKAQGDYLRARPQTITIDSRALRPSKSRYQALSFADYPFATVTNREGQLVFYCQDAYKSANQIIWSSLARDYGGSLKPDSSARESDEAFTANSPSAQKQSSPSPSNVSWCKSAFNYEGGSEDTTCPALTGEWQLRSPLMPADSDLQNTIKGATLTDPKSGQRVPQIPPAGAELL
ncbi:MAG: hypothetical protein IPM93_08335 [Candidatus Obscuribacter sp.]|nr:hypothetical protein [Candidatus Obscuribacter sp.]